MTGIGIIAAVVLLFVFVFSLPVSVTLRFDETFFLTVRLAFFPVFRLAPNPTPKENAKKSTPKKKTTEKPKEKRNFFEELKEKRGFSGAVSELFSLARRILIRFKRLLRHMVLDQVVFVLRVSAEDAAKTAIQYGEICAAAYPVFGLLDTATTVKFRQINITADFAAESTRFSFSAAIRTRVLFLLVFALGVLKEFLTFRKQVQNDE